MCLSLISEHTALGERSTQHGKSEPVSTFKVSLKGKLSRRMKELAPVPHPLHSLLGSLVWGQSFSCLSYSLLRRMCCLKDTL